MRLETITIVGFGRLTNVEFSFHPGINLIVGPNEAGKSTLLQAIFTLLYGFYDAGSVTSSRRELMNAYQPWESSTEYRASLTFSMADRRQFRVERNFGNRMKTSIYSLPNRLDISSQFRSDSYGRLYFADDLLSMNRTVFENTCCLRQSELVKLESSATAITDAILRLATDGAGEANSTQAIEILQALLRDEIGSLRAWTKPLASAHSELKRLGQEAATATQREGQMWSIVREIRQYEERIAHLAAEKERREYLKLLTEQIERRLASAQIDRVRQDVERQRRAVAELQRYSSAPVHLLDELIRCANRRADLKTQLARTAGDRDDLERQLKALEQELVHGIEPLGSTELGLDLQPATRDHILSLHTQWRHALTDKERAAQSLATSTAELDRLLNEFESGKVIHGYVLEIGATGIARLQDSLDRSRHQLELAKKGLDRAEDKWRKVGMTEDSYQAYVVQAHEIAASEVTQKQRKGCNPFRSAQTPVDDKPTDMVILQEIAPIHDAEQQAKSAYDKAWEEFRQAGAGVRSSLNISSDLEITDEIFEAGYAVLEELKRVETRLQLQKGRCTDDRENLSDMNASLTKARATLSQALKTQGVEADDPDLRVEEFVRSFDRQIQQANARAKYEAKSAQLKLILGQLQQFGELDTNLLRTEQQICEILLQADPAFVQLPSLDEGILAFRQLCQQNTTWSTAKHDLEIKEQQLLLLQHHDHEEGTIHQLEVAGRRLQQRVEQHPEWRELAPDRSKAEYEQQIQEISGHIQAAETEIIRLRHTLESLGMHHTPLADLLEQQGTAAEQHSHLTHIHGRVTEAIAMLEKATTEFQRLFAPRLEKRIAQALSSVTGGRYQQAQVTPTNLGLFICSPESDKWVPAEHLSTGTRDLIYLAMRVAISDLLSSSKEPLPLLLDDPFVHFDATREQKALAYLSDIAKEYQILFFSKDHTLEERLQSVSQNIYVTQLNFLEQ